MTTRDVSREPNSYDPEDAFTNWLVYLQRVSTEPLTTHPPRLMIKRLRPR